jgi:hypothetical protein
MPLGNKTVLGVLRIMVNVLGRWSLRRQRQSFNASVAKPMQLTEGAREELFRGIVLTLYQYDYRISSTFFLLIRHCSHFGYDIRPELSVGV